MAVDYFVSVGGFKEANLERGAGAQTADEKKALTADMRTDLQTPGINSVGSSQMLWLLFVVLELLLPGFWVGDLLVEGTSPFLESGTGNIVWQMLKREECPLAHSTLVEGAASSISSLQGT